MPSRPPSASHDPGATAPPRLRATQQCIVVRDLTVACRIGVTEEERAKRQRLCINLTLNVRAAPPQLDRISEVVDYGRLAKTVRAVCAEVEFRLLESLAGRLAAACFFDARVEGVRVRIEKLDRYADMTAIGCEIVYDRGNG